MTSYVNVPDDRPLPIDGRPHRRDVAESVVFINRVVNADIDVRRREHAITMERDLSELAASLAPSADWVTISLVAPGQQHPRTLESPGPGDSRLDEAQYASGQGPCLDVLAGNDAEVSTIDLLADARWPSLAVHLGHSDTASRSVVSRALVVPHGHRACLNLYGAQVGELVTARSAQDSAAAVGIGLSLFLQRRRAENLEHALNSNRLIGAALGVLMARHRWTYDEAFERLRACSQNTHRKLHVLADEVVTTGELPGSPATSSVDRSSPGEVEGGARA